MPKAIDLTGRRFGRLTVVAFSHSDGLRWWRCRCDCGNECLLPYIRLTQNNTRSCGCLLKDTITKHGGSSTAVYRVWHAMLQRCHHANDASFADYGGRGISVCARWHDYRNFIADMGPRPPRGTLERIDVNGNYEPANCRWATQREQANNRRNNTLLTHNGETKTAAEWARWAGLTKSCLLHRLKAGWSLDQALSLKSNRGESFRARRDLHQV